MGRLSHAGGNALVEEKIKEILKETLLEKGFDLYEVRYKSGKNATLNVVVDRVEPISLEDIVSLSELISASLDEADPIAEAYTLDVSSLGAEKPIPIEKLPSYVGRYVNLHLVHPVNGENILEGTLASIVDGVVSMEIKVKTRKKVLTFPLVDVDRARLAIAF